MPKSFAIESTRFLSRLPTLICQLGQDDSDEAEPTAAGQPTGPPAVCPQPSLANARQRRDALQVAKSLSKWLEPRSSMQEMAEGTRTGPHSRPPARRLGSRLHRTPGPGPSPRSSARGRPIGPHTQNDITPQHAKTTRREKR